MGRTSHHWTLTTYSNTNVNVSRVWTISWSVTIFECFSSFNSEASRIAVNGAPSSSCSLISLSATTWFVKLKWKWRENEMNENCHQKNTLRKSVHRGRWRITDIIKSTHRMRNERQKKGDAPHFSHFSLESRNSWKNGNSKTFIMVAINWTICHSISTNHAFCSTPLQSRPKQELIYHTHIGW